MDFSASSGISRLHDVITRIHADPDLDSVLQAIVDGVVEVCGFGASVINVYRAGTDEFEVVAAAGDDERELESIMHKLYPAPVLLERTGHGEEWGPFRFVSHRLNLDPPEGYIVLNQESSNDPNAWHPLDELSVELRAPNEQLLGIMYIDRPNDGILPSEQALAAMEIYAVAAGIAIHNAQQQAEDREEAWLGGLVRSVIDHLAGGGELSNKLDKVLAQLRTELQAPVGWLDVFGGIEVPGIPPPADQPVFTLVAALDSYGQELALNAIETGQAVVLDRTRLSRDHPLLTEQQRSWLARALTSDQVSSVALAPLDNDEELAGQLVLGRRNDRAWRSAELDTLREIGRELGWALGRERSRERERLAEEERDRAARDRRGLLYSISAEITPHFATLDTHLATLPVDAPARMAIEAIWTLFDRVQTLVAFERPDHRPQPTGIDMSAQLGAVWQHLVDIGRRRGVQVLALDTAPGQFAWADPHELEWVVHLLTEDVVLRAASGCVVRFGLITLNQRLVLSCQVSGLEAAPEAEDQDDDELQVTPDVGDRVQTETVPLGAARAIAAGWPTSGPEGLLPWWHASAQQLLARSDGRLSTREGPMGRRVVSLSLPVPHTLS